MSAGARVARFVASDSDDDDGLDAGVEPGYACPRASDGVGRVASRPGYPLKSPVAGAPSDNRSYPSRLRSLRSLRAPLARRFAALPAAGRTRSRQGSTASSDGSPRSPRADAPRHARRRPRLARPGRLRRPRASPGLGPVRPALRRSRRTARSASAGRTVGAPAAPFGTVLRTRASARAGQAVRSIAAAAPLRRALRRRFPDPPFSANQASDPPGRALGFTPHASLMQSVHGAT